MTCPHCAAPITDGARFCEACGASLSLETDTGATGEQCRCGAGPDAKGPDGYCASCGLRWPVPRAALPRDHVEVVVSAAFAGVTDRGRRHAVNEDALALAQENDTAILVVCDGVSSSQRADDASEAAALAVCGSLKKAAAGGSRDPETAMRAAIAAGHAAACLVPYRADLPKDPPGATVVAATVRGASVTVGWLGDSRAYWVSGPNATAFTHDHSWVNAVVDAGEMSEKDALESPEAHAITKCLGPLNGDAPGSSPEPSVRTVPLAGPGALLLCTDGLWNYAPSPTQIADLVGDTGDVRAACRRLVEFALTAGGRDNVTVALWVKE